MCLEKAKNDNLNTQIERYFAIKVRKSIKMQKIKKQRCHSRQLFENVKFLFILTSTGLKYFGNIFILLPNNVI